MNRRGATRGISCAVTRARHHKRAAGGLAARRLLPTGLVALLVGGCGADTQTVDYCEEFRSLADAYTDGRLSGARLIIRLERVREQAAESGQPEVAKAAESLSVQVGTGTDKSRAKAVIVLANTCLDQGL